MAVDMTPQSRAALVTFLLMQKVEMTTAELADATGISGAGVRYLMDNLSLAGVPIYKPCHGHWAILREAQGGEENPFAGM